MNREGPDQTARMRSLIWAFAVRVWYKCPFWRFGRQFKLIKQLTKSTGS